MKKLKSASLSTVWNKLAKGSQEQKVAAELRRQNNITIYV